MTTWIRQIGRNGKYNLDIHVPHMLPRLSARGNQYCLKYWQGRTKQQIRLDGCQRQVDIKLEITVNLSKCQAMKLQDQMATEKLREGSPFLI